MPIGRTRQLSISPGMDANMLRLISEQRSINKDFDRRKPITSPTFFNNDAQRPPATKNPRRIIFVKQADGSFRGQYSDGSNWQTFLATAVSFATPAITYGTTFGAGTASTTIRSDAQLKYPIALMSAANSSTLTLTDDATNQTLTGNLGQLTIAVLNGMVINTTGTTSPTGTACLVNLDPVNYTSAMAPQLGAGDLPVALRFWDAKASSQTNKFVGTTFSGYDTSVFSFTPPATSSGTNNLYAYKGKSQVNNNNATWGDLATAYFAGPRRSITNLTTVTTQAALIIEPPTASTADQIGIYIRQQGAQAGATNRYGLKIDAQNSGTNKFAISAITDPSVFGPITTDGHTFNDAKDIVFGTGTGTKIGTATTQKFAFWNSAPMAQPAVTGTASSMVAGGGAAVDDKATFTGGTGATAYRIDDVINNLKTCGILKA